MDALQHILVPIDFSPASVKLVEYALHFAKPFKARVTLLYVAESLDDYANFPVPHISLDTLEKELRQSAERKMDEFIEEYGLEGKCSSAVLAGQVSEEIVKYARENQVDLIIIGTHGYKGIEKILLGSVVDRVLKSAPCPVLTVNPYR